MDENKLIDAFGEMVDKMLREEDITLVATFPKGSLEPEVKSSFDELKKDKYVFELYMVLHILRKEIENLIKLDIIDQDKKEELIDSLIDMVKNDLLKEDDDEEKQPE